MTFTTSLMTDSETLLAKRGRGRQQMSASAIWTIWRRDDAAEAVHSLRAYLPRTFRRYGTTSGFIDWLYLNRLKVDAVTLREAAIEYVRDCQRLGGRQLDKQSFDLVRQDENALQTFEEASLGFARLVARLRRRAAGNRAISMLAHLADNQGAVLTRSDDEEALLLLREFMLEARGICHFLPPGWRLQYFNTLMQSMGCIPRRLFTRLERYFVRTPMHNVIVPHEVVQCAVAVVMDEGAHELVAASLESSRKTATCRPGSSGR